MTCRPGLTFLVSLLLDEAGGQVDIHRQVGGSKSDGQQESSLGFGKSALLGEGNAEVTVSISTGRIELDGFAESGFCFCEFALADETATVFLETIRFG